MIEERIEMAAHALNAVSHSIAGPLQSVMNRLFILRRKARDSAPLAEALEGLETDFRSITDRLDELLVLPHVFRSAPQRKVGLREIVHSAVALSGLTSSVTVNMPSPDMTVFVDGGNLTRAIAAVLVNAAEASDKSSTITLKAGSEGPFLEFRVSDHGTSLWPAPPEKAFDPLYTTKAQSLGLGLPMALRVAQAARGGISIEPGDRGSTVSIVIPMEVANGV